MIRTARVAVALTTCLSVCAPAFADTSPDWKFNPRPAPTARPTPPPPTPRYDFDFRGLDLRTALKGLADRENRRILILESVPASSLDQWYLRNSTCAEVWFAFHKAFNIDWVTVDGVTYVGSILDLAQRFPKLAGMQEVVLPYSGDPGAIADFAKVLQAALPAFATVYGDRTNGALVVVGPPDAIAAAQNFMVTVNGASAVSSGAFVSQAIPLRGTSASEILPNVTQALGTIYAPNTIVASADSNALVVSGTPEFVKRAEVVVGNFDHPVPMVRLDVAVVSVEPQNDNFNFGVQWGGSNAAGQPQPASGSAVTLFTGRSIAVNAQINALESKGQASVLTRGALYARNNRQSSIDGQTDLPVPVTTGGLTQTVSIEHFKIGALIKVTPTITTQGLLMNLDATYATLQGVTGGSLSIPIIQTNESQNYLTLHNDQSLVIGGTYTDTDSSTISKVPVIGDIPLIGGLFKNKQQQRIRQQVVFIVTPHYDERVDSFVSPAVPIGAPSNLNLSSPIFNGPVPNVPPAQVRP